MPIAWVSPPKWEYYVDRFSSALSSEEVVETFNDLGAIGWELVAVETTSRLAWFKRLIPKDHDDQKEVGT
jgi:hypothetical protein